MISVCIATYNGEKYIREQIRSILSQTKPVHEIIISDNCSTDRTLEILRSFEDNRIKIFSFDLKDVSLNFENALKNSKGEYIFLSDQDDIWAENKVEVMFNEATKFDLVISNAMLFDESGEIGDWFTLRGSTKSVVTNLFRFSYLGCCFLIKRDLLLRCFPFPPHDTLVSHDNWLYINAALKGKISIIEDCLVKYRRHSFNVSGGLTSMRSRWQRILYRLRLFYFYANTFRR